MASQPEPVGNEVIAKDLPLIFKVCVNTLKKTHRLSSCYNVINLNICHPIYYYI